MYNKRTWLNSIKSDLTSSIVAFDGEVTYKNKPVKSRFLEISDCQNKIKLHQTTDDTKNDFIERIKLLKSEIEQFINHLTSADPVKTRSGEIQTERVIELSMILIVVCWENNVNVFDVKKKNRFKELATARREYCYLACKLTWQRWHPYGNSLWKIGQEIDLNHATVLYHKRKIEDWLEMGQSNLREKLELIEGRLRF